MNICTEELARTRWCPLVRYSSNSGVDPFGVEPSYNRWGDEFQKVEVDTQVACLGSACMAWRMHGYDLQREMWFGYCGAFGGPEPGGMHPQSRVLKTREAA